MMSQKVGQWIMVKVLCTSNLPTPPNTSMYRTPTPTLRTLKEASQMGKKDTPDLLFHFGQKIQSRIMIQMVFTFHLFPGRRPSFAYQGLLKHLRDFVLRKVQMCDVLRSRSLYWFRRSQIKRKFIWQLRKEKNVKQSPRKDIKPHDHSFGDKN